MKNYEIMFIVRPDVEETVVKNTVKTLEKVEYLESMKMLLDI